ncbi:unnamed protein product [Phaeothamnion confervicola]
MSDFEEFKSNPCEQMVWRKRDKAFFSCRAAHRLFLLVLLVPPFQLCGTALVAPFAGYRVRPSFFRAQQPLHSAPTRSDMQMSRRKKRAVAKQGGKDLKGKRPGSGGSGGGGRGGGGGEKAGGSQNVAPSRSRARPSALLDASRPWRFKRLAERPSASTVVATATPDAEEFYVSPLSDIGINDDGECDGGGGGKSGRSRSARRSAQYATLSSYSAHFVALLGSELRYEKELVHDRLASMPAPALQRAGLTLLGLVGTPRGRLFKDHIVRFSLPPPPRGRRRSATGVAAAASAAAVFATSPSGLVLRPELPFHRFGAGDVIAVTAGAAPPDLDGESDEFCEAIVVERTPYYLDVAVAALPAGLILVSLTAHGGGGRSRSNGGGRSGGGRGSGGRSDGGGVSGEGGDFRVPEPGAGTSLFRLDQYVNGVSYERMLRAVRDATAPQQAFESDHVRSLVVRTLRLPPARATRAAGEDSGFFGRDDDGDGGDDGAADLDLTPDTSTGFAAAVADEVEGNRARAGAAVAEAAAAASAVAADAAQSSLDRTSRARAPQLVAAAAEAAGLNERQAEAVRCALERRLTLVQGPPGTGKTRTACAMLLAAVRLAHFSGAGAAGDDGGGDHRGRAVGGGSVLACAFSNVAADGLLEGALALGLRAVRVGRPATVRASLRGSTLDALLEENAAVAAARARVARGTASMAGSGNNSRGGRGDGRGGAGRAGAAATKDGRSSGQRHGRDCGPGGGGGRAASVEAAATVRQNAKQAQADLEALETAATRAILLAADVVVSSCIGAGADALLNALAGDDDSDDGGGGGGDGARGRKKSTASITGGPARTGRGQIRFATVLVDEATQATEPATLVPLLRGCDRLILVGDQNQLPPTVLSPAAQAGGLGRSLFARLLSAGVRPILLNRQYRAHPAIARFPSDHFYGGLVLSEPQPEDRPVPAGFRWPRSGVPLAFVPVALAGGSDSRGAAAQSFGSGGGGTENGKGSSSSREDEATSWCNAAEAAALAAALRRLLAAGDVRPADVGVITPYAAQVRLLTDVLRRSGSLAGLGEEAASAASDGFGGDRSTNVNCVDSGGGNAADAASGSVEVASVDGYQGREKEVILLSAVRSNPGRHVGFLADWRRLNVAITRARRGLIIFGDPNTLSADPHWAALLRWYACRGLIVGLPASPPAAATAGALDDSDTIK